VGNFLTDRPSSRVLAAPGGASTISFGDYVEPAAQRPSPAKAGIPERPISASAGPGALSGMPGIGQGGNNNNYARPGGQNVGNFLTDRNSSRVVAPPGGASSITFG
jgi:SPIRAL1-like protein